MGGNSPQTTQQTQNSVSSPWTAAQPMLQSLLDKYSGQSTAVTPAQTAATNQLTSDTSAIPNMGASATGALNNAFGFSTTPQIGMLSDATKQLQSNLSPISDPTNLNPYNTPGFSDAMSTMTNDITKNVKNVYAGSGRDPAGAGSFAGSLGRGLVQGEAPVIAGQYNTNVSNMMGANKTAFDAGNTAATGEANLGMLPISTGLSGIGAVPGASTAYASPGATALTAANAAYSTPWTNLSSALTPAATIGSLGGQTSGSGTSTTTPANNMLSNIIGGGSAGIGMLSMLMSDKRAKTDIQPVGKLDDGQTVHRFRYKGSPTMQIGLLAQDVAKKVPGAVGKMPGGLGMLGVDYKTATDPSVAMRKAA